MKMNTKSAYLTGSLDPAVKARDPVLLAHRVVSIQSRRVAEALGEAHRKVERRLEADLDDPAHAFASALGSIGRDRIPWLVG